MPESSIAEFSTWLKDHLWGLRSEIDVDIFSDYIQGILEDETLPQEDHLENIKELLSSVLESDLATIESKKIVDRFAEMSASCEEENIAPQGDAGKAPDANLDDLATQMRSLMQQKQPIMVDGAADNPTSAPEGNDEQQLQPKQLQQGKSALRKERDEVTKAALRAAGVSGYQDSEENEAVLSIAQANEEFLAKQRMVGTTITTGVEPTKRSKDVTSMFDLTPTEAEHIDLEELEDAAGYGKKEGIKPMSVMDALSELNPQRFSSSKTAPTSKSDLKVAATKRLPTPGDVNSSTPAYLLMASRSHRAVPAPVSSAVATTPGGQPSTNQHASNGTASTTAKKVKAPAVTSKHLAEIGAKAEKKHLKMVARNNEKLSNVPVAGRKRLDDMDAFFMSDDDDDDEEEEKKIPVLKSKSTKAPDILLEGGGNRERVELAQKQAREASAAAHAERRLKEKAERQKQLEAEATRKASAQAKVVKQERRRR